MLRLCGWSLAKMSGRAARRGHKSLKAQLLSLKSLNAEAEQELNKRRRLRFQRKKNVEQPSASPFYESSSSSGGTRHRGEAEAAEIALLPRNNDLETAIALSLYSERDARAELEFTRQLVNSTLLSLASPVGPWDPYDVKPQVFALDNYLALPVFTSIEYLRLFCDRFGFTVRDPSGVLWAAGQEDRYKEKAPLLLPEGVLDSMSPTATEERETEAPQEVTPEALFEDLSEDVAEAAPIEATPSKKKLKKKGRKKKGSLLKKKKKKKMADHPKTEIPLFTAEEEAQRERVRSHFREKIAATNPFHLTRATPIPVFGPFLRSFLVGYFADVNTLLHNASIVPEKVDIILNPTSLIELVLAREATDRVLHRDKLLHIAYKKVEKVLQREFGLFFQQHCPEVRWAKSACIPRPLDLETAERALRADHPFSSSRYDNPLQEHRQRTNTLRELQFSGGVVFDLVILLDSEDLPVTFQKLQWGKQQSLLLGHRDLDLLPAETAAPHVREVSTVFYDRTATLRREAQHVSDPQNGVFLRVGESQTISAVQPADSYYHDPTNAFTEAHSVYTEELKLRKGL